MKKLLKEGHVQEFFLEGTRSRTGKLLSPKLGMLSMEIDAFAEGACEELSFAPISITYEKVVEEASYTNEIGGATKKKEKFFDLLKTPRFLLKKYGRVYLQFAPPIALRTVLQEQGLDLSTLDVRLRKKVVEDLAQRVSYSINEVVTVTPSSLLATVLLNHEKRGITKEELLQWVSFLMQVLKDQGARVSLTLRNIPWAVEEALGGFVTDRLVQRFDDPEGTIFMVEEAKRIHLDYYKNSILHFFVPFSFAANLFAMFETESLEEAKLKDGLAVLMRIFRREFIFSPQDPIESYQKKIREYLVEQRGFLSFHPSGRFHQSDPIVINYFSRLLHTLLESYLVVLRTLEQWGENEKEERVVVKEIMATADRLYRRGDLHKLEARSMVTFRNAIELFMQEGFITPMETKGGDKKLFIRKESLDTLHLYRVYLERMLALEASPNQSQRNHPLR
jgi:glycerol-3-phosphate O-acyltransferase